MHAGHAVCGGVQEKAERGFLESDFLLHIVSGKQDVEPFDYDCKCVYVWHTKTLEPDLKAEKVSKSDPTIMV